MSKCSEKENPGNGMKKFGTTPLQSTSRALEIIFSMDSSRNSVEGGSHLILIDLQWTGMP